MRKVDMCMAKDKVMDMDMEFDFASLASDVFGEMTTTNKISTETKGMVIGLLGHNGTGKTTVASQLSDYTFVIPLERGATAVSSKAQILKTRSYADFRKHVRTLTTNKKLLNILENTDKEIVVLVDGMENLGLYATLYTQDNFGVSDMSAVPHGKAWSFLKQLIHRDITQLVSVGYTVIYTAHIKVDEEGYADFKESDRVVSPFRDVSDLVCLLVSNGQDENGRTIKSSAYLTDSEQGFARCRFPYVDPFIEEFTAENLKDTLRRGIQEQIERDGLEEGTFKDTQALYSSNFDLSFDEAMDTIYKLLDEADAKGLADEVDNILLNTLESVDALEKLTSRQMETVQTIHDDLKFFMENK